MRHALFLLIAFSLAIPNAGADTIEISGTGLSDVYTKEIESGKKASIKIFLKSSGDPLDGYIIQLFKTSGAAPVLLLEKKTDGSGIVTVNGVVPSRYLVALKRGDKSLLSVQLGDIRILKEGL